MQNYNIQEKLKYKSKTRVKRFNPRFKKNITTLVNFVGKLFFLFRRNKLPSNVKKVLFISLYFNGDILFQSPVFRLIEQIFPDAEHHIWIKSRTEEMLSGYPQFAKVLVFNDIRTRRFDEDVKLNLKGKFNLFRQFRNEKYDLIIDFTGLFWTAFSVLYALPKYSAGFNFQGFGFIYNFESESVYNGHLIEKYISIITKDPQFSMAIQKFGVMNRTPNYTINEISRKKIDRIFDERGITDNLPRIILHTTAGWKAKEWGLTRFSEFIKILDTNCYVIIIGGKVDAEIEEIIKSSNNTQIFNFTGLLSMNESAEVIRRGDLFVGVDSGPLYLAEAVGTPTLSLFGPTNPLFSAPVGDKHHYIYKSIYCSAGKKEQNCKLMGGLNCKTIDCMNLITPKEVADFVSNYLKDKNKKNR